MRSKSIFSHSCLGSNRCGESLNRHCDKLHALLHQSASPHIPSAIYIYKYIFSALHKRCKSKQARELFLVSKKSVGIQASWPHKAHCGMYLLNAWRNGKRSHVGSLMANHGEYTHFGTFFAAPRGRWILC